MYHDNNAKQRESLQNQCFAQPDVLSLQTKQDGDVYAKTICGRPNHYL